MRRVLPAVVLLLGLLLTLAIGPSSAAPSSASGDVVGETSALPCPVEKLCDTVENGADAARDAVGNSKVGQLAKSVDDLTRAVKAIGEFSPATAMEGLAKDLSESAVRLMGKITDEQATVTAAPFRQSWWQKQYAVLWALSLIIYAFMLVAVGGKIAGRDGSTTQAISELRERGARIWFVPVILAVGPLLLSQVAAITTGLTRAFGSQGAQETNGALSTLTRLLGAAARGAESTGVASGAGAFSALGGAAVAVILMFLLTLAALVVLVELALASYGTAVVSLLLPIALVLAIHPLWRDQLTRLVGLVLSLLLIPAFVNLVYWSFWSGVSSIVNGMGSLAVLIYVLVGFFTLAAAPVLAWFLLPKVVPNAGTMAGAPSPSMGASALGPAQRMGEHFRNTASSGSNNGPSQSGGSKPSMQTQPSQAGGPGGGQSPAGGAGTKTMTKSPSATGGAGGSDPGAGSGSAGAGSGTAGAGAGAGMAGAGAGAGGGAGGGMSAKTKAFAAKEAAEMPGRFADSYGSEVDASRRAGESAASASASSGSQTVEPPTTRPEPGDGPSRSKR